MAGTEGLSKEEARELVLEKSGQGWIKAWFAIEVMATRKETAEESLKEHVEKLVKVKDILVFEKKFSETEKVEHPPRGVEEAYSQVAETSILAKNLETLMNVIIAFGPSSVEILEPKELKLKIDEVQNMANMIAGLMHQFAYAGMGGMVLVPKSEK